MKDAREDPSRLAVAEGVEDVESDLRALEERERFGVAAGHAVLEDEYGVVGERRHASLVRRAPHEEFDAATGLGAPNGARVAVREAVQFTVAHRHRVASHVEKLLPFGARELLDGHGRRALDFARERNVAAREERRVVVENFSHASSHARARLRSVAEFPSDGESERVVERGALRVGDVQALEAAHEPREFASTAAFGRAQEGFVRKVVLDVSLLFEQREKAREHSGEASLLLVAFPFDIDARRVARSEPSRDVVAEDGGEVRARDAGNFRLREFVEVFRIARAEFVNAALE